MGLFVGILVILGMFSILMITIFFGSVHATVITYIFMMRILPSIDDTLLNIKQHWHELNILPWKFKKTISYSFCCFIIQMFICLKYTLYCYVC